MARRRALRIGAEGCRARAFSLRQEGIRDFLHAAHGFDAPRECEDVAPVAFRLEEAFQQRSIAIAESAFEPGEPVVRDSGEGVGSSLHRCRKSYINALRGS